MGDHLTKKELRALWRAVDDMRQMFYAGTLKMEPPLDDELIQVEREKLEQAKRALRKLYKITRAAAAICKVKP